MALTLANGKLCYLQIPATEVHRSAAFYADVFGWRLHHNDDGTIEFDDSVNEVSGTWVTGRPPAEDPGLLLYILVDDVAAALATIEGNGGEIIQTGAADPPEARFRDPGGNVLAIFEQ